jgi:plasmid segregation protein ParM
MYYKRDTKTKRMLGNVSQLYYIDWRRYVMAMFVGTDGGNYDIKYATIAGVGKFISKLGEYRDRSLITQHSADDLEYEYMGKRGFAGTLAENESRLGRSMGGDSKAHEDAKIRILLALHRLSKQFDETVFDIVVGQPIRKHAKEKEKIVAMLQGQHTIKVNEYETTFTIRKVNVAPEGACAYWAYDGEEPTVRIIDIGSRTVNGATIKNGRFLDKGSFTEPYGSNSDETLTIEELATAIIARATNEEWLRNDAVRICGGVAEKALPYIKRYFGDCEVIRPRIHEGNGLRIIHPTYANAVGFYNLARALYE